MSDKIRLLERALKEIKGINSLGGFDFNTLLGALLNQIPEGSIQFEESLEYIFFEGDETEEYITFETIE